MAFEPRVLARGDFDALIRALVDRGYQVVGPTVRDDAIVYEPISSTADLPIGIGDTQDGGTYRLTQRDDDALFGYNLGPHSWKKYLFPPKLELWQAKRENGSVKFVSSQSEPRRYAFLGIRACELAAISVQDRVFVNGSHSDPHYVSTRGEILTVGVNCAVAGGTCFCVSMGTGPRVESGYDIVLTEVITDGSHQFVCEAGSDRGAEIVESLPTSPATENDVLTVDSILEQTARNMGRVLETTGLPELLAGNPEHPRWDEVASRCLACTNCTLVCPTCFCSTTEDATSLATGEATRSRRWDSCFALDFSELHGTPARSSTKARYRHWMTHKLSTWHDQFDVSGCVGCGRCITWCPVGIDITEESAAIRATAGALT